jgi:hypothetical protein
VRILNVITHGDQQEKGKRQVNVLTRFIASPQRGKVPAVVLNPGDRTLVTAPPPLVAAEMASDIGRAVQIVTEEGLESHDLPSCPTPANMAMMLHPG